MEKKEWNISLVTQESEGRFPGQRGELQRQTKGNKLFQTERKMRKIVSKRGDRRDVW